MRFVPLLGDTADPTTAYALNDQLNSMSAGLSDAMARGDTSTATTLMTSINAVQAQIQAGGVAPSGSTTSPSSFFSSLPWWVWAGAAAGLYFVILKKKRK